MRNNQSSTEYSNSDISCRDIDFVESAKSHLFVLQKFERRGTFVTLLDDIRSRRFLRLSFPLNATDRNSFKVFTTLRRVETKIKLFRGETTLSYSLIMKTGRQIQKM